MGKAIWRAAGVATLAAAALPLLVRSSPWPGAWLVRRLFARSDARAHARLARHVRPGIEVRGGLAYGSGSDERLDLYRPPGAAPLPLLVWVHGGGWVGGSRAVVGNWLQVLAGAGYATAAIGYSTARPGVHYPTPLHQLNRALAWLDAHADTLGIDRRRIVLGGSSAGAQISAQLALAASSDGYARRLGLAPVAAARALRGVVLLSGAFDLDGVGDNWFVNSLLWAYTGRRDFRRDPWLHLMAITPHLGSHFPPAFVSSGNADPLAPQARKLVQRMQRLGLDCDSLFFAAGQPRSLHEFQFDLDSAAGQACLARLLAFLSRVAGAGTQVEGSDAAQRHSAHARAADGMAQA